MAPGVLEASAVSLKRRVHVRVMLAAAEAVTFVETAANATVEPIVFDVALLYFERVADGVRHHRPFLEQAPAVGGDADTKR